MRLLAILVIAGAAVANGDGDVYGAFDCVEYETFRESLDYCSPYVTWPITPAAASQLAAREALALARYTQLRQWFEQGNVTAACLSYQAFYQCATFLPACRLGEAQELCSFVCEEHAVRCDGDKDACTPSDQYCSAAAVPALSLVVALAVIVAGPLVALR